MGVGNSYTGLLLLLPLYTREINNDNPTYYILQTREINTDNPTYYILQTREINTDNPTYYILHTTNFFQTF